MSQLKKAEALLIKGLADAARIAAMEEREACAELVDKLAAGAPNLLIERVCEDIAAAIRARGGR